MLVGYVGGEMDTGYNNACDYLGSPNNVIRRPLGHDHVSITLYHLALNTRAVLTWRDFAPSSSLQHTWNLCDCAWKLHTAASCTSPSSRSICRSALGLLTLENVLGWCAPQELCTCPLEGGTPTSVWIRTLAHFFPFWLERGRCYTSYGVALPGLWTGTWSQGVTG